MLSPHTALMYQPVLDAAEAPWFIPLSTVPHATLSEFFRYASYITIYVLVIEFLDDKKKLCTAVQLVLATSAVIAFVAIIQHYAGTSRVWWVRELSPPTTGFFGPFAYKNHFGGYAAMLLPLAVALFLYYWRPVNLQGLPIRRRLVTLLSRRENQLAFCYGLVSLLLAVALLLSRSRGGIICGFSGCTVMLFVMRRRFKGQGIIPILFLVLLIILGLGRVGLHSLDSRFGQAIGEDGISLGGRGGFWKDGLGIVRDYPLTGTGAGTFPAVFGAYKSEPLNKFVNNAHNDFLETVTDNGFVGMALLAVFFWAYLRTTYPMYRKRRDRWSKSVYLGSLAGAAALLMHAFVDYQFRRNGAVGLYFFFLLGFGAASVHARREGARSSTLLRPVELSSVTKIIAVAMVSLFLLSSLTIQSRQVVAQWIAPDMFAFPGYQDADKLDAFTRRLQRAGRLDPLNPEYQHLLSWALAKDEPAAAQSHLLQAMRLSPATALYYQGYGGQLAKQGRRDDAERAYDQAIQLDPTGGDKYWAKGIFLIESERTAQGLAAVRRTLELLPARTALFLSILRKKGLSLKDLEPALPPTTPVYLAYASLWVKEDNPDQADLAYRKALSYLGREETVSAAWFITPYRFYRRHKMADQALAVVRQAVEQLPDNYRFRLILGDLYRKQGLVLKAGEQYRLALTIRPDDQTVRSRLEHLL
ncbi:O-antigen ligase family protein [Desulfogranum mediterraneum]|uniref:O-antigen ligase family protein n=1 Tax=Desulfogranum mediterraneum TaxID=160661 RepID=UPI0013779FE3|nr:O-antigen ligase family protein [Desulfogranum mediterraneum]